MIDHWHPLAAADLTARAAVWLAAVPGVVRVAVDAPPFCEPQTFAGSLVEPLHALSRPAVLVRADDFLRDASVRLERGKQDWESYLTWLDADALRREVLEPAMRGRYLPSLRDPASNRSTRAEPRPIDPSTVVLVAGEFLLGRGLPFDRVIHFATSPDERARRTPAALRWTLPAFDRYDTTVGPLGHADVVVKGTRHPVVGGLP